MDIIDERQTWGIAPYENEEVERTFYTSGD